MIQQEPNQDFLCFNTYKISCFSVFGEFLKSVSMKIVGVHLFLHPIGCVVFLFT